MAVNEMPPNVIDTIARVLKDQFQGDDAAFLAAAGHVVNGLTAAGINLAWREPRSGLLRHPMTGMIYDESAVFNVRLG